MNCKRKPGTGSLFQRKDGRWEGRVVIGYNEHHNPKTKCVYAKSKLECSRKLEELLKSTALLRNRSGIQTFGEWMDCWYQFYSKPKLRITTRQNYENWIYNHLLPELGSIPIKSLSQERLQEFFNHMKTLGRKNHAEQFGPSLSASSVHSCFAVCKMALNMAVQKNLIKSNPVLGCKLPPVEKKEMKVLSIDEIQRFLIQAKEDGFYELFLLELVTGLRRGELLGLQWNDLNLSTGELQIKRQAYPVKGNITIGPPKTKAALRTIILPPQITDVLSKYKKGVFSKWLFPSRLIPEQPIDSGHVMKQLHKILARANCKDIRFHDLRHTFATICLESGMDAKTLSVIMGHASSATTLNIYAHVTDDMLQDAAYKIESGMQGINYSPSPQNHSHTSDSTFEPIKRTRRLPGTGCISRINDHLWEGRYSPIWIDGNKHCRCVYAHTQEECEVALQKLIVTMKAELHSLKSKKSVA